MLTRIRNALFGPTRPRKSDAELIEERLVRRWIQEDPEGMEEALGNDDEARELIKTHKLYVAFNTHATEPRWEVSRGNHRTFFCPEYPGNPGHTTLGAAVRECVSLLTTCAELL